MMVRSLRPLDADCRVDANHFMARGALNINASFQYLIAVDLESVLEGEDVVGAHDHLLASEKENRIILTGWTRQYYLYGEGGTSKLILEEGEPIAGVLEPNASSILTIPLSMIGPVGAYTLMDLLLKSGQGEFETGAEVVVRFQIQGKVASTGKKVETVPMEFPVVIYLGEALPTCEAGESLEPVGPCGLWGGQDSFVPNCCVLNPNSGKCAN